MRIPLEELKEHIKLIYPSQYRISQDHGVNEAMYSKFGLKGHNGIDIACPTGSNIIAPCKLEIVNRANDPYGYGIYVRGRGELFTFEGKTYAADMVFAHLQGFVASLGAVLDTAQLIAISDNTGNSTGPHVHWGLRIAEKVGNSWLTVDEDNGFSGYIDQSPLIDYKSSLVTYDGKVVWAGPKQDGSIHYEFVNGKFNWIADEFVMDYKGYLFSEAVKIKEELIATPVKGLVEVDKSSHEYLETRQIFRLLSENPSRAKQLKSKYE